MNLEVKKLWIEALRSDEYKQGRHALCSMGASGVKEFCCLGVLVDLYIKKTKSRCYWRPILVLGLAHRYLPYGISLDWQTGSLPDEEKFKRWIGEIIPSVEHTLVNLNDTRQLNFDEIADWIEEHL